MVKRDDPTIILGSAFFAQYVGIFDVEEGKMGISKSRRAIPTSTIECFGEACPKDHIAVPSEPSFFTKKVLLIIALVTLAFLICFVIVWCKCRTNREKRKDAQREVHRVNRGKKGYSIKDEKDDDESDEEDENNPYATLN